jgi:hypothetical protein
LVNEEEYGKIIIMSKQNRKIDSMIFEYTVKECGTSSHIILPVTMVWKRVKMVIKTYD